MRLFVVEFDEGGGDGEYQTRDEFAARLRRDVERPWHPPIRPLWMDKRAHERLVLKSREEERTHKEKLAEMDAALLAKIDAAVVGDVVKWRLGYAFVARDDQT